MPASDDNEVIEEKDTSHIQVALPVIVGSQLVYFNAAKQLDPKFETCTVLHARPACHLEWSRVGDLIRPCLWYVMM